MPIASRQRPSATDTGSDRGQDSSRRASPGTADAASTVADRSCPEEIGARSSQYPLVPIVLLRFNELGSRRYLGGAGGTLRQTDRRVRQWGSQEERHRVASDQRAGAQSGRRSAQSTLRSKVGALADSKAWAFRCVRLLDPGIGEDGLRCSRSSSALSPRRRYSPIPRPNNPRR
jgi:hypothetical protein